MRYRRTGDLVGNAAVAKTGSAISPSPARERKSPRCHVGSSAHKGRRMATASVQNLSGYARWLAECNRLLSDNADVTSAVMALKDQLQLEVTGARNGLSATNAEERQQVHLYYTALSLWNSRRPQKKLFTERAVKTRS